MSGLTLLQLRTQSKQRADMVNSLYLSDAEWNSHINDGGSELHDLILLSDPNSIMTIATINVVSGTESYALPAAFYKMLAVYRVEAGIRYALDRTDLHGLGDGVSTLASVQLGGKPYRYALVGNSIYLSPKPSGGDILQIWYYPSNVRATADDDTFDYPIVNGWEQFIVLTAVIKAKMKEESDVQAELAEKAELKKRIIEMAVSRDQFNPPRARDDYGTTSRFRRYNMMSYGTLNNIGRW